MFLINTKIANLLMLAICAYAASSFAAIKLPKYFSDDMILQRDAPCAVAGWASAGSEITARINGKTASAKTGTDGKFRVMLPAMPAGGPYDLTVSGDGSAVYKDVYLGDIWLCSGQSNMEILPRSYSPLPAEVNHPKLRLFYMKGKSGTPQEDITRSGWPKKTGVEPWLDECATGKWEMGTKENLQYFSVVAYYFGRRILQDVDVPMGLIDASYGGTSVYQWTDGGEMYNANIHPFTKFKICGVLWWQGTGDLGNENYEQDMREMVAFWRAQWDQGNYPFIIIQSQWSISTGGGGKSARLRQRQLNLFWTEENLGLAVTADVACGIHPKENRDIVGTRGGLWALKISYKKNVVYSGPIVKEIIPDGNKVRVTFHFAENGLKSITPFCDGVDDGGNPWQIAGAGGSFYAAQPQIDGSDIVLSASAVAAPKRVTYAFSWKPTVNLGSTEGFPASPFNSDMFPGAEQPVSNAVPAQLKPVFKANQKNILLSIDKNFMPSMNKYGKTFSVSGRQINLQKNAISNKSFLIKTERY
jgi:sialate O-acetylesterase